MDAAASVAHSPIGLVGRVSVPIPESGPGEVMISLRGGTEAFAAWADTAIGKHVRVMVVDQTAARSVVVVPLD